MRELTSGRNGEVFFRSLLANPRIVTVAAAFLLPVLAWAVLPMRSALAAEPDQGSLSPQDLSAWRSPTGAWQVVQDVRLNAEDPSRLTSQPGAGVLVNGPQGRTVDLLTKAEFGDVQVHVEFCISRHSNSGVYFMGRYEVQVYDSYGVAKDKYPGIECGGLYPRWTDARGEFEGHSPRTNVSKPAGQWQSFDVVFRAPRFDDSGKKTANARFERILHNGELVHENVEVTGPTRAAHWNTESATGPLLLQGDHGPVAYRNLRIRRIEKPRSPDSK